MQCGLCQKVALRVVGGKGYCKDHTPQAFTVAKEYITRKERNSGEWDSWQMMFDRESIQRQALRRVKKRGSR